MTHSDVIIGHVVTSSIKLHQKVLDQMLRNNLEKQARL